MASKRSGPTLKDEKDWIPDNSTDVCLICSKSFSMFFRKHHCRVCGKVVCSECVTTSDIESKSVLQCIVCKAHNLAIAALPVAIIIGHRKIMYYNCKSLNLY